MTNGIKCNITTIDIRCILYLTYYLNMKGEKEMKVKKFLVCLLVILSLLGIYASPAYACTKSPNCYSTSTYYTHSNVRTQMLSSHTYTYGNGYSETCLIYGTLSTHNYYCAGCDSFLYSSGATCAVTHSVDFWNDRYNC